MSNQTEYEVCINASILSSLEVEKIKNLLVVSLFDIDTEEKISDGDNDKITVLDYYLTTCVGNNGV
ncbi:hypothetical protein BSPLISOX_1053 [uncultured Gammaproteobacteria bacterium]|jgi:hypothetical protein|nr:hypothetical protein BSPLISOX_1053 [uncultured Gammaproteobacteria bacterium]